MRGAASWGVIGASAGLGALRRRRGAAFSPLSLSPALWLDASDSSTLFQDSAGTTPATANNDVVGRWSDKSGNGRNATQGTTGAKVLLKTAALNGKNALLGDGVDDVLSLPNFLGGFAAGTGFTVWRPAALSSSQGPVWHFGVYAATHWGYTGGHIYDDFLSSARPQQVNGLISAGVTYIESATHSGTTMTWRHNASQTYSAAQPISANLAPALFGNAQMTRFLGGYIAEILLFSYVLSAAQIAQVESYLVNKWGVTL